MRAGDVLRLDRACSVQFIHPITVRVIRKLDWITYDGWCWIDCYQLGSNGEALARRSLFLMPEYVQYVPQPPPRPPATGRKPVAKRRGAPAAPLGSTETAPSRDTRRAGVR
ncbi:hypothetical protein [Micromonospora sp. NPDC005205]|uniref:hypothetical protein n=1 Tax=Micromonospora sp. NPDC005205 TaxID=3156714 RepID=UPI0033B28F8C